MQLVFVGEILAQVNAFVIANQQVKCFALHSRSALLQSRVLSYSWCDFTYSI